MCRIWRPSRNSIFVRSKLLLQVISLWLIFTLRIDVYALRDLMGHCYVHFAFLFTLKRWVGNIRGREDNRSAGTVPSCVEASSPKRRPYTKWEKMTKKKVTWSSHNGKTPAYVNVDLQCHLQAVVSSYFVDSLTDCLQMADNISAWVGLPWTRRLIICILCEAFGLHE